MTKLPKYNQQGQALLIVLLGMAVALTMILSVVSRSITDIQLTSRDEESQRAFSAAEAGVERALFTGESSSDEITAGVGYSAQVSNVSEGTGLYTSSSLFKSGQSETIWFVSHDDEGEMTCTDKPCTTENNPAPPYLGMNVCWGVKGTSATAVQTPAAEVMVYYDSSPPSALGGNYANVRVAKWVFDPNTTRTNNNNFTTAAQSPCAFNSEYQFGTGIINFRNPTYYSISDSCLQTSGCLLFAKIKMVYNNTTAHPISVQLSNGELPGQSILIESRGSVGNEAQSVIEATKSFREIPTIFESAIFSMGTGANLSK